MSDVRKALLLAATAVFLAACSAPGASVSAPTQAASITPELSAPVVTASPTAQPSTPTSVQTLGPTPTPAVSAGPSPNAGITKITITNPEPGPGRKVGIVEASFGDYIYYQDLISEDNSDGSIDYCKIIQQDKKTGVKKELRRTNDNTQILQLFTDETGNLYYLLSDDQEEGGNFLYQYQPGKDLLIATNVFQIVRVDDRYIYYQIDDYPNNYLYSYDLSKKTISKVNNDDAIVFWTDGEYKVDWTLASGGSYNLIITNSFTGKIKHCNNICKGIDLTWAVNFYVDDNFLFVVVNGKDASSCRIYKIDMNSGKTILTTKINGTIDGNECITIHNGKLYFFSSALDNEILEHQKLQSYNLKTGRLEILKKFIDDEDYEKTYTVEYDAGSLWIICKSTGDGSYYSGFSKFIG